MSIPQSGGKNVKKIRYVLPSTGDFDGNLRISLSTSYIKVVVRAGVIKVSSRQTGEIAPKLLQKN